MLDEHSALRTSTYAWTADGYLSTFYDLHLTFGQDFDSKVEAVAFFVSAFLRTQHLPFTQAVPAKFETYSVLSGAVGAHNATVGLILSATVVETAGAGLYSNFLLHVVLNDFRFYLLSFLLRETSDVANEEVLPHGVAHWVTGGTLEGELSVVQVVPAELPHRFWA